MDKLKKLTPVHYLFIILNILGIILEYFVMYKFVFKELFNISRVTSLIMTSVILLIFILVSIYINRKRDDIFEEEDIEKISNFHLKAIKEIRQKFTLKTSKNIKIRFVDGLIQPSVMFALIGDVYINTNKKYNYKIIDDVHFEGVLSHELGHVMHMPNIYFIANLRPTAILGNLFFVLTFNLSRLLNKENNKIFNYTVFALIYLCYLLFNLINILILYPFKRYEEFQADKLSLNFSNGYSLRGYYYKLYTRYSSKLDMFRFKYIDLNHPTPLKHYQQLNQQIITVNSNCELISHNNILVKTFLDNADRLNKIVKFYDVHVDKSIISMYMYIGKCYEELGDNEKAKDYYLLAGKNDIFIGYRRLIIILKKENNIENVLEYYKILSKNGDKEANIYLNYYEKEFALYMKTVDGEEIELEGNKTLKLLLNDTYIKNENGEITTGKITRRRTALSVYNFDNTIIEYYFKEGEIVSKKYTLYDSETDTTKNIQEFYH